ncbi:MAG TPA: hypothetical protein P5208_03975 [Smithellaceae bacterium]|nr:hypothetical protein [Smithellaceae bacterium]HRV44437.1 hypothetical protein [Smithellaceae bacterium]
MSTDAVRLNITLPKDLVAALNRVTEPGQRNRFITESLKERLMRFEKMELEAKLTEGYQATAREGVEITKEFSAADLEHWDEY